MFVLVMDWCYTMPSWRHCIGKVWRRFELVITLFICGNKEFGILPSLPTPGHCAYKAP